MAKNPIYKKWWFWGIIVIVLLMCWLFLLPTYMDNKATLNPQYRWIEPLCQTHPFCELNVMSSETWINSCNERLIIFKEECPTKPYCKGIGTKSEGWYCNNDLIEYEVCNGCHAEFRRLVVPGGPVCECYS